MNKEIPIIFIHYGDSDYLFYILDLALKTNPGKDVILLGDDKNKKYEDIGVQHFMFKDYFKGQEVEIFDKVYQFITGKEKRKSYWINFVFKRWFAIYNFMKDQNIEKFWTFDSDTLILGPLSDFETPLSKYDCTDQCNAMCMNGLINNISVVKGYIDKINELFQRQDYLEEQRQDLKNHSKWAFTEMRAYATYKKESNIKTIPLMSYRDGIIFDHYIFQPDDMQTEYSYKTHTKIKKLYFKRGKIYEKEIKSGALLEVRTINMSWVPLFYFEQIYYYSVGKGRLYGLVKSIIRSINRRLPHA